MSPSSFFFFFFLLGFRHNIIYWKKRDVSHKHLSAPSLTFSLIVGGRECFAKCSFQFQDQSRAMILHFELVKRYLGMELCISNHPACLYIGTAKLGSQQPKVINIMFHVSLHQKNIDLIIKKSTFLEILKTLLKWSSKKINSYISLDIENILMFYYQNFKSKLPV